MIILFAGGAGYCDIEIHEETTLRADHRKTSPCKFHRPAPLYRVSNSILFYADYINPF